MSVSKWAMAHWERELVDGNRPAVDRLAFLHMGHGGGERNPAEAVKWLFRSKKPQSYFDLGSLYRDGEAVEKDPAAAFRNFLKAAKEKHQGAIVEVVKAYETGVGVSKDRKKAEKWRKKVAR